MKHRGSCVCGQVVFDVVGTIDAFFLCHCSRCRKSSGSAHGANLFSATATVTWLSGQANVKTYRPPDTRFARSFCNDCGASLPTVGESHGITVPAGSLDSALTLRPNAHIHCGSRARWDDQLEQLPKLDGLPLA